MIFKHIDLTNMLQSLVNLYLVSFHPFPLNRELMCQWFFYQLHFEVTSDGSNVFGSDKGQILRCPKRRGSTIILTCYNFKYSVCWG